MTPGRATAPRSGRDRGWNAILNVLNIANICLGMRRDECESDQVRESRWREVGSAETRFGAAILNVLNIANIARASGTGSDIPRSECRPLIAQAGWEAVWSRNSGDLERFEHLLGMKGAEIRGRIRSESGRCSGERVGRAQFGTGR